MLVKMKVFYNDSQNHFGPGEERDVDDVLGKWLIDNRKAEEVKSVKAEVKAETYAFTENVTNVETYTPAPVEEVKPKKRSKK